MATMKGGPVATLLGDLVASRTAADRAGLHHHLARLLETANQRLEPVAPFRITVGDEFQARFATVGEALRATLWLRLALQPHSDLRHGVGWGPVEVLGDDPPVEDGPGWWAARAAIEAVKSEAARPATRRLRTAYRLAEGYAGPDPAAVNAALVCRDHVVGSASARSSRLLWGTLEGRSQAALAEQEGISPSAVSQRMRHDGLAAVLVADELLGGVGS